MLLPSAQHAEMLSIGNADLRKSTQVAALPLLQIVGGEIQVIMVTSRDTGRWVMPKGWEMPGIPKWEAAGIEAFEEAGVEGRTARTPIGTFHYTKRYKKRPDMRCEVSLFLMRVEKINAFWKECHQRTRGFFSLDDAAGLVHEEELAELLREAGSNPVEILRTI